MRIRVAAPDANRAGNLIQQLVAIPNTAAVRLDGSWAEVTMDPGTHSDRIIARVLRAVENWLDDEGVDSAEVNLDDHSYVIARNRITAGEAEWS